jgi:ABC-type sugar transport system substrate-binding protein
MDLKSWYQTSQGIATELGGIAVLVSLVFWLKKQRWKAVRIVLVSKAASGYSQTFVDDFRSELQTRCPHIELTVTYSRDEEGASFRAEFGKAIELHPSIIVVIIPHKKNGLSELAKGAILRNIPIICVDQGLDDTECFFEDGLIPPPVISCDNARGGALAAQEFARSLGPGTNIAIVTGPSGSATSRARKTAFIQKALDDGMVICAELETNWDASGRSKEIGQLVSKYPGLGGVFCCNDNLAIQVLAIFRSQGGAIPQIIGFDGIVEAHTMVKAGALLATIDQNIAAQASLTVTEIMKIASQGKKHYIRKHKVNILLDPTLVRE